MTPTFDTHFHIKRLQKSGFLEAQAEALLGAINNSREADNTILATKADLDKLELSTKADLKRLEISTQANMQHLELKIDNKLKDVQLRLGSMIVGLGGVLVAVKYFG